MAERGIVLWRGGTGFLFYVRGDEGAGDKIKRISYLIRKLQDSL